jgi:hypothetical protein
MSKKNSKAPVDQAPQIVEQTTHEVAVNDVSPDTQHVDLVAQIADLTAQLLEMKNLMKNKSAKVQNVKTPKQYSGLNGHYFMLKSAQQLADDNIEFDREKVIAQVKAAILHDAENLSRSALGRAMIKAIDSDKICFFAPNQEELLFGPVRAGVKSANEIEIFTIPLNCLIDLGHGYDFDKAGKIRLETEIEMDNFHKFERDQRERDKLLKYVAIQKSRLEAKRT